MKKIQLASTFSIYPPSAGGKIRIFYLYRKFSKDWLINITSLTWTTEEVKDKYISDNVKEKTVLFSRLHGRLDRFFFERVNVPITDAVLPLISRFSPAYRKEIARNNDADVLIASHPFFAHELLRIKKKEQMLIYEAHNVEYLLKKQMYPDNFWGRLLLRQVSRIEKIACHKADLVISVSDKEKDTLADLYDISKEKIAIIPNGVDCDDVKMRTEKQYKHAKEKLESSRPMAIFVGSAHIPNTKAAKSIIEMAKAVSGIDFLLVGGVCDELRDEKLTSNVKLMGFVEDEQKNDLYKAADIALNPMEDGSGSNLKIAEYFAAGIPCVTTPTGARGYDIVNGKHAVICKIQDFVHKIKELNNNKNIANDMSKHARKFVEEKFDWQVLAKEYEKLIENRR